MGRPDFAGKGGGLAPFGMAVGNRITSEITGEAASAEVAFLTVTGRAPGLGGTGVRSVFAGALSLTKFPAGVELLEGRKTEATGFGFSLSFELRTLSG